jgi:hypothetical protein
VYQLIIPELAVALKLTTPAPQRLLGVVDVIVGAVFTVATTEIRVETQPSAEVVSA